jgi:hypothetical protein
MPIRAGKRGDLDDTARRFLQVGSNAPEIHKGQQADEEKQRDGWERMLFQEACEFGDDLVRYVAMHKRNTPEQLAWGVCLGLFCARNWYPNGEEEFDELTALAAKDLVLAQTTIVEDEEEIARIQTEMPQFSKESFEAAAEFSENFQDFIRKKKTQVGMSNKQGAYGLGRAFHNLRRTFPKESGGSAAFDELARRAGIYFAENREE